MTDFSNDNFKVSENRFDRTFAEISLENIANNVRILSSMLKKSRLMAVVKANGYGHGAFEVSKIALENGASALGVATVGEGVFLREKGIDCSVAIHVLGEIFEKSISDAIKYKLVLTVSDLYEAELINEIAGKLSEKACVHIKVDTGMLRIGFDTTDESVGKIIDIFKLKNICVDGIFSHFACSDNAEDEFTKKQHSEFVDFVKKLEKLGYMFGTKHMANSGALLNYPEEYHFDLVRAGILLYGLPPSSEKVAAEAIRKIGLRPALSWKSRVSFVKNAKEGSSVGYGRTHVLKRDSVIATVPVGYADGLPRALSNKGYVLINGEKAHVIGNVCMDQFMVDVTDICDEKGQCNVVDGDEVVLIGVSGKQEISAETFAEFKKTINYEVVTQIGERVPRKYM